MRANITFGPRHSCINATMCVVEAAKALVWCCALTVIGATLASCGTPTASWYSALDGIDASTREGKFLYAYMSLRTVWMAASPDDVKQSAIARAKASKEVLEAGYRDLAKESVNPNLSPDFPRWLAFHQELADVDMAQLQADGRRFEAEDELGGDPKGARDRAALLELITKRDAAKQAAVWKCNGPTACDKSFALAQIFVNDHADMKIQVATNTIVETYNPIDSGKIGIKVIKIPLSGEMAELRLTVVCKRALDLTFCLRREVRVYEQFLVFMTTRFQQ